jgi:chromosome segregation ATPase
LLQLITIAQIQQEVEKYKNKAIKLKNELKKITTDDVELKIKVANLKTIINNINCIFVIFFNLNNCDFLLTFYKLVTMSQHH